MQSVSYCEQQHGGSAKRGPRRKQHLHGHPSRIFLGDHGLTVWIMPPRHPQIANRIAKSKKAVQNLVKPFGTKIPNLMKYPDPEGVIWQIISPITTLQSDPENLHFKYKSTKFGPHFGPEAVFRAFFGLPEQFSKPHRPFRVLGQKRAKKGHFGLY